MKKTPPSSFPAIAVAAAALGALVAGGVVYKNNALAPAAAPRSNAAGEAPQAPLVPDVPRPDPSAGPQTSDTATIYRVVPDENGAHLAPLTIPIPANKDARIVALDTMAGLKDSPLPPGTRVRTVDMEGDGVAHVDFSGEFKTNFSGGDTDGALAINAVLATMAQFYGVESVRFTVMGKTIDTLGGTQDLTDPQPVPTKEDTSGDATSAATASAARSR